MELSGRPAGGLRRLLVVPATMFLLGKANWWTPRWLSRLPNLLEPIEQVPVAPETPSRRRPRPGQAADVEVNFVLDPGS